ncbi:hypothetical protein B0T26DRAFT_744306 [Lasiosphaeria miniovina]|uniref:Fe2OG dioxygenase domain-containing protein n=1 Tax=Lasiosphaeria miniovina TaxID=1954250 RepID=A0AA40DJD0_9PEZI|nr:uncharacterized protein B0T26DRAFT_744306 [Lasiosphaeria miniovina]KAK0703506.1 hypothetical protein B0T26DRAFT_744306 [Lasiosphaeria miniovina]
MTTLNVYFQRMPARLSRLSTVSQPEPSFPPSIWSKWRGSLCEALPYFKAYKGSLHTNGLVATGFLMDKHADPRDVFDGQVIISSVPNGTGTMVRLRDASDSSPNIKAFRNAQKNRTLLAVIAEKRNGIRVFRVRYEKADLQKPSCKLIYTIGWTCLNHECAYFLKRPAIKTEDTIKIEDDDTKMRSDEDVPEDLEYNEAFLFGLAPWIRLPRLRMLQPPGVLEFDRLMTKRRETNQVIDDQLATRLNRTCLNDTQTVTLGSYTARQYFLPDPSGNIIGSFTLLVSNPQINSQPFGPDHLFREIEQGYWIEAKPNKLEGYTRHFQQNFGARYKFGVAVQSKGFDQAPEVILRALHRLIWAGSSAVKKTTEWIDKGGHGPHSPPSGSNDFNELLALGYMEDDRISYHDDGESELGPTVAALSLGSPSIMKFRPKVKIDFGKHLPKNLKGLYRDVLEAPMKHGDIMVMHGQAIHKLYEHTVEPMGGRRFSLTCRYIDPDKMQSQSDKDDAAVKGAIPAASFAFKYDGN